MNPPDLLAAESVLRAISGEQEAEFHSGTFTDASEHADDRLAILRARRILLDRAKELETTKP